MAETVHLFLKANGKDVKGESTQLSLGRADSIECIIYEQGVETAREAATNMMTGRRQYKPLRIVKRVDKASPLLMKALTNNEKIDGKFMFFRPNPSGDGTTEQFYTVEIKEGNIASIKDHVQNTLDTNAVNMPPLEEVTFVFRTIKWTFMNGGVTHEDSWSGNK